MWVAGSHQSKLGELPAHTPLAADIADELARTETVSDATARHQTALEKQEQRELTQQRTPDSRYGVITKSPHRP